MSGSFSRPVPIPPSWQKQPDQKFCYACAAPIHVSASSCPACGAHQLDATGAHPVSHFPAQVFCRGCGGTLHQSAPLCPHCGAPQAAMRGGPEAPERSRVVAAVLAIILGGFGAHKFYLGEIGLGIAYLLFSWTLIPAIVGVVEGIVYLGMSDENFARKYC